MISLKKIKTIKYRGSGAEKKTSRRRNCFLFIRISINSVVCILLIEGQQFNADMGNWGGSHPVQTNAGTDTPGQSNRHGQPGLHC